MSENLKNIASAKAKSLKTSLRKANLVLRTIRGKKAENALNILAFSNKRISNEITKILKSAIANAENNNQLDIDKLFVKEATVGKSMVLKRFRPRARGRSGKILKPFSKIKILVEELEKPVANVDKKKDLKDNKSVKNSEKKNDTNLKSNELTKDIEKKNDDMNVKSNKPSENKKNDTNIKEDNNGTKN